MSTAFDKHGIEYLSPSSLRLWRDHPGLWCMQYLGKYKSTSGPAAWWGKACELSLADAILRHWRPDSVQLALTSFDTEAAGEISDEIAAYRDLIEPTLEQLKEWGKPEGKFVGDQIKVLERIDGISIPLLGYIDLLFDNLIIDLKCTKAAPLAAPRKPDVRQVAFYSEAKKLPAGLLYATPKKTVYHPITADDAEKALNELRADASSLENFLSRVDSAADALAILPFDDEHYRVNEATLAAREAILGGAHAYS